jgi:hypothetical protein
VENVYNGSQEPKGKAPLDYALIFPLESCLLHEKSIISRPFFVMCEPGASTLVSAPEGTTENLNVGF